MLNDVLGKLKKYHDRSLFGRDVPEKAAGDGGYYVIEISPVNNGIRDTFEYYESSVKGLLEKFPEFNINANWSEQGSLAQVAPSIPVVGKMLGGLQGILDAPKSVLGRAGFADMGAVYQSKKIYSKSGYLDLSVTFKVINWSGEIGTSPIHVALTLFSYLLPVRAFDIWSFIKTTGIDMYKNFNKMKDDAIAAAEKGDFGELTKLSSVFNSATGKMASMLPTDIQSALSNFSTDLGAAWNNLKETPGNIGEKAKTAYNNFKESPVDYVGVTGAVFLDNIQNAAEIGFEYADDNFMLRKQPAQVKVRIGKFFENADMIVENVNVNFSEEMTEAGPLWADFTVKLSSRTIMYDISKVGFKVFVNGEWRDVPPVDSIDNADMFKTEPRNGRVLTASGQEITLKSVEFDIQSNTDATQLAASSKSSTPLSLNSVNPPPGALGRTQAQNFVNRIGSMVLGTGA